MKKKKKTKKQKQKLYLYKIELNTRHTRIVKILYRIENIYLNITYIYQQIKLTKKPKLLDGENKLFLHTERQVNLVQRTRPDRSQGWFR